MTFTKAQWLSFQARIINSLDTLTLSHELNWSGNFWTCQIYGLGTVVFHEYYQRYSVQVKDVGSLEGIEGMNGGEVGNAVQELFHRVYMRPNGEAAKEESRRQAERDAREARRQQAQSQFLKQLD